MACSLHYLSSAGVPGSMECVLDTGGSSITGWESASWELRSQQRKLYLLKDVKGGHCRPQQPGGGAIPEEVELHSACGSVQVRRPLEEAPRMLLLVPTDVKMVTERSR